MNHDRTRRMNKVVPVPIHGAEGSIPEAIPIDKKPLYSMNRDTHEYTFKPPTGNGNSCHSSLMQLWKK